MSVFPDRANTAVLVIDVQVEVMLMAERRDDVVSTISAVVDRARASGVPVIWVQHDDDDLPKGSEGWQIVPELVPAADEPIVGKNLRDSFENTTLEAELAKRDIGRLIVTGAQTDFCVRWTLHGAFARGYDTVLIADAHTTDADSPDGMPDGAALIAHTNSIWGSQTSDRCTAEVLTASELRFPEELP